MRLGKIFLCVILISAISAAVSAEETIQELREKKERLELEAAIAESTRKIQEDEALASITLRQKEANAKKAVAEAERAEALAKVPPSKIEPLSGSVDVKDLGIAGLVVAVDVTKELAENMCTELFKEKVKNDKTKIPPISRKATIYDADMVSGVVSAHLLKAQITLFKESLKNALKVADPEVKMQFLSGVGFGVGIATGTIKAFADLASVFKTNVTVTKTEFGEVKKVFVTAMANSCAENIIGLGAGYLGELDLSEFELLRNDVLSIIKDRSELERRINELKEKIETKSDKTEKNKLETTLEELQAVAKQVDGFIGVIKTYEVDSESPLLVASKYLSYEKLIKGADVLDLDVKIEGLSIVKDGLFSGQKLRLSAAGIISYRLYNLDGTLKVADVIRKIAKPIQIDLRGDDAAKEFWQLR